MACRVIAFMNQKGGCGKTATAVSLGAIWGQQGHRTLVVDGDPQQNTTLSLGINPYTVEYTLYDALLKPKTCSFDEVVVSTGFENLDLVPSHDELYGADLDLVSEMGREERLKRFLRPAFRVYDYILIDSPPSLSLLSVNILNAAREVFIILQAHPHSYLGLEMLLSTIQKVQENLNPDLAITGVIVTIYDTGTKVSRLIHEKILTDPRLKGKVMETLIRKNITMANCTIAEEAEANGVPIFLGRPISYFDPGSHGAKDYEKLAREIETQSHNNIIA